MRPTMIIVRRVASHYTSAASRPSWSRAGAGIIRPRAGAATKTIAIRQFGVAAAFTTTRPLQQREDPSDFNSAYDGPVSPEEEMEAQLTALGRTEPELKKAYLKLAMSLHPDSNPDDDDAKAKFVILGKTYERLLRGEGKKVTRDL